MTILHSLLAEIPDWSRFASAEERVAYAGLNPSHRQSGNKIGYTTISKRGNTHLRKTLSHPALSAMRHYMHLKQVADRLKAAGKAKMVVVVAIMRRLLASTYAMLKTGKPYDPNYQAAA